MGIYHGSSTPWILRSNPWHHGPCSRIEFHETDSVPVTYSFLIPNYSSTIRFKASSVHVHFGTDHFDWLVVDFSVPACELLAVLQALTVARPLA